MSRGCGRFSDAEWADLIGHNRAHSDSPLSVHAETCPSCRAELDNLLRFGRSVRAALDDQATLQESFVHAVLAEVKQSDKISMKTGTRTRRSTPRRLPARPLALASAGVFVLLLAFVGGLLPWIANQDASTGYTAPGGTILTVSDQGTALNPTALSPQGVSVAVSAVDAASAQPPRARATTALPIHRSRGIAVGGAAVGDG